MLGAAQITPAALIDPANDKAEVLTAALAARDATHSRPLRHGTALVHDTYEALIADPDVDAVHNRCRIAASAGQACDILGHIALFGERARRH